MAAVIAPHAEGCIDGALASWLLRRAGYESSDAIVGGGWSGVVQRVVDDMFLKGLGWVSIGFVDADDSARQRRIEVESHARRRVEELARRRRLAVNPRVGIVEVSQRPLALRVTLSIGGRARTGFIVFWCRQPSRSCDRGTVEDVLLEASRELWDCPTSIPSHGCGSCDSGEREAARRLARLWPPVLAAACSGARAWYLVTSTLDSDGRRCCGLDVTALLDEAGDRLAESAAVKAYIDLLRGLRV